MVILFEDTPSNSTGRPSQNILKAIRRDKMTEFEIEDYVTIKGLKTKYKIIGLNGYVAYLEDRYGHEATAFVIDLEEWKGK
jgi:hypothetical protein